ncbi:autoinducer 2 ABC transporter substrate-binding protein [Paenibacillus planticolens]|uniref:Substrate-binding domain-containing protein n=1 Tax=Paenibacillus planticolens TaxID=2654976 RepID=A0ABX1ZY07_9BACL|nr:autoinducer 2 ABC transporter substrate-binding protein [Paenibacillus planticolens]NOV03950.1 substrate-binding domain-containing protein [Paenibacillus planticolens]
MLQSKKMLGTVLCSFLAMTIIAGCSSGGSSPVTTTNSPSADNKPAATTTAKKEFTVAVVPKLVGIPYFNSAQAGAEQAGKDLGIKVIYTGPTQADAAQQSTFIQDLITKKVDAIAVSANDPTAIAPVLKKAQAAGIKVLTWDADAQEDSRDLFVSQTSDEALGRHIMDTLAQQMGEEGEFAIITGSLTAGNLNTWMDYMKKQAAEKYPKMKLASVVPCDDDQQKALTQAQNLISAYPNLKGIIGNSSAAVPGAAEAVKKANKNGQIKVVGLSTPNLMKPYLKDNSAQMATLWSPKKLGYLTVAAAKDMLDGKTLTDGQDIPNVGKVSVQGKVLIMGQPTDFTKDNVDQYDF